MRHLSIVLAAAALAGMAGVATAQSAEDPAIASARASGSVGEQADGYLGIARGSSPALKSAVDAINIKRRAIYTDLAAKRGATVQDVGVARGCEQLAQRVQPGQAYKLLDGGWQVRGASPIQLPGYCKS